jgi:hypothetical protein
MLRAMGNPGPEQDAQTAKQALAAGDLMHAAYHIGCALSSNPTQAEWLQILDATLQRAPDPLKLCELEGDGASFVTAATRAWVLARTGKWVDAFSLLTDVIEARPDVPYLVWGEWWLTQQTA